MNTPIVDFVKNYNSKKTLRLHMPGHKGESFLGCEPWDITEIDGADVLYKAEGIIKQSEDNAAKIFGTEKTVYSTEGSSLAIRAMLYLIKMYGNAKGEKPIIAAGRNAHKTFITAAALLDLEVEWLNPKTTDTVICCDITPRYLEKYLNNCSQKPLAVYVTSPDYLGNMLDISALASVCKKKGVLLLVDNAHGAYLRFLPQNLHPIALGADMCCDSAHKTLPVITGGAYLHIGKNAPKFFSRQAENAMSVFASTSPSYLILQSMDMANKYITDGFSEKLEVFIKEVEALKTELTAFGYMLCGNEPLKLTIATKDYGYTGEEFAGILEKNGIVCEFCDPDFTVMMLTENIGKKGLAILKNVLLGIKRKTKITEQPPKPIISKKKMSPNAALFALSEELAVDECCGRVLKSDAVTCPPAIPIVICGEEITENAVKCFEYYGIKKCSVVIEENKT